MQAPETAARHSICAEISSSKKDSLFEERTFSAFEKLLESVGSNGVYQRRLIGWLMIPLAILYGLAATNFILVLSTPNHVCYVPGRENFFNITEQQWQNMTIPWETGQDANMRHSQCKMYNVSFEATEEAEQEMKDEDEEIEEEGAPQVLFVDKNTELDCQYGWYYDTTTTWKETAVSHYDWVCDRRGIVTHLFTLKMIGGAIGTFGFALLSDKYGRRPTFYASLLLCVVFGPAMALAPSLLVFSVFEFCFSLAFYTLYQMPFLIVMELCSEKLRSFTVIASFLACIFGICLVSLISWLVADWKIMLIVFHVPMAIFFLYWRFIPESPRWLLSQNKIEEFRRSMRNVASINGREFTKELDELIVKAQEEEKKKVSVVKLFSSPVLTKHLFLTSLLLCCGYMFYSGISLNLHNMIGNTFVNFFILTLFEIPGNLIGSYSTDFLGRRISSFLFEALSAVSILITTIFLTNKWGLAICCGLSKMFVGGMILPVYMQIGELFPTPLRATAYGITGIIGMAATVVVPTLMALGGTKGYVPYYILCAFSVVGAITATFLPETLGLPLPQTLREATAIGKNQSYFSLIYKGNAHKLLNHAEKKSPKSLENGNIELMCQRT